MGPKSAAAAHPTSVESADSPTWYHTRPVRLESGYAFTHYPLARPRIPQEW